MPTFFKKLPKAEDSQIRKKDQLQKSKKTELLVRFLYILSAQNYSVRMLLDLYVYYSCLLTKKSCSSAFMIQNMTYPNCKTYGKYLTLAKIWKKMKCKRFFGIILKVLNDHFYLNMSR